MRLIDMLAGRPSDDPSDKPSGEKITVEPSVSLLRSIDNCAKAKGLTREQALAAYAALAVVGEKAAGGLLGALSERAREINAGYVDPRTQELRLAEGIAAKNALEEAVKACEEQADAFQRSIDTLHPDNSETLMVARQGKLVASACATAIQKIKDAVVKKTIGDSCSHTPVMDGQQEKRVATGQDSSDPLFVRRICAKCGSIYTTRSILGDPRTKGRHS